MKYKLSEIALFNPTETLKKGTLAKKVGMDKLQSFCRDIPDYEIAEFSGGTKFRNGDTIMARITPCLENGKTAKVNILNTEEVGFGSTEYIVFRAIDGVTDEDYLYYLVCSPIVRDIAIKSMVGSSGRQRVQTDVVKGIEIELPTLDEQRKIGWLYLNCTCSSCKFLLPRRYSFEVIHDLKICNQGLYQSARPIRLPNQ